MIRIGILLLLAFSLPLGAAEFFISPEGDNQNTGISPEHPWRTLQRAFDGLKPGDIVTLLPGVYHESVESEFTGGDAATVIRAAIPGSVVLRGDIDAPAFEPVPSSARVWACAFPEMPQAVNERDTLRIYRRMPSVAELEYNPGSWFYDRERKMLYVNTGDSAPPARHYLTVSDLRGSGIRCGTPSQGVRNLVIGGIVFTGFNANSPAGRVSHDSNWGVFLAKPENCVVRDCVAFLNGGGIGFGPGSKSSTIENIRAYANHTPFYASGGNIIVLTPSERTAIRSCLSFDSDKAGIRFYGSEQAVDGVFEDNISFGNGHGDLWVKYPSDTTVARRCVAGDGLHSRLIENSLFNQGDEDYFGKARASIIRPREKGFSEDREFADPLNFDYRPQSTSRFRDRSPAPFSPLVHFVKNGGDDRADGNSVDTAWKSLTPALERLPEGGTLYLLPGEWKGGLTLKNRKNLTLRGRGAFPVELDGGITLENCENILIERLGMKSLRISGGGHVTLRQSGVNGPVDIRGARQIRLQNNAFTGGAVRVDDCKDGVISSNLFGPKAVLDLASSSDFWSGYNSRCAAPAKPEPGSLIAVPEFGARFTLRDASAFNGRGADGMPIGPYRRQPLGAALELNGPHVLSQTATTANVEFRSNLPVTGEFRYGNTRKCENRIPLAPQLPFHSVSLTGLKPGGEWYFQVAASGSAAACYSNQELPKEWNTPRRESLSEVRKVTQPREELPPQTRHVAVNGDDRAPGSAEQPWRTISHAAANSVAGDTVLVHDGTYRETVRIRATGDNGRPLTFRAAPGAVAWLDGDIRQLLAGFVATHKNHLTIDGFRFREFPEGGPLNAGISLLNADDVTIRRCFYDGRSSGYTTYFVRAAECARLRIDNCFLTRGFQGMVFDRCPDLLMRNSVIFVNQLTGCQLQNLPEQKATFRNNIWVDNTPQKVGNPIICMSEGAALEEYDNCYLLRVPPEQKPIFSYNRFHGETMPISDKGETLNRQWRRQGRFGRELATYDDYLRRSGRPGTAIFADPQMRALKNFIRFNDLEDWEKNYEKVWRLQREQEHHWSGNRFLDLDFPDFFAANPELIERNIGLEPKEFEKRTP